MADHADALEFAKGNGILSHSYPALDNLAAAYLELREMLQNMIESFGETTLAKMDPERKQLIAESRAALGVDHG